MWFKKKKNSKKLWLVGSLCAVGGAGAALAIALPLTLSNTTTLHSLKDVDNYLRNHKVQGPATRDVGFYDHEEFVNYAKKNFSNQFYLNTMLITMMDLVNALLQEANGPRYISSDSSLGLAESTSIPFFDVQTSTIKINEHSKGFRINWTDVVSIIMDGEKQEFKDSLMVDFDRTNNGFVLNTWSSGYSLYYNETSGDLSVIPFSAHEERQVNNDILLCSYSSSSSSSILYREQQGQYSKPIGRSKESRWIDIGLGQKQKIAYPYSYLTISPYDFTNIVWKYILDEGTPLNTLITVVNLGNIEVNNGQTIEENIWQAICDKNPDIDFTNYEDDIVFHSIHSTAAMVVGIQPRISGVVTVTYTLSFIAFRCDNYSEGV